MISLKNIGIKLVFLECKNITLAEILPSHSLIKYIIYTHAKDNIYFINIVFDSLNSQ